MQRNPEPDDHHNTAGRRRPILIGTAITLALVVMIALHLTGVVGANSH
jgi:hypothetical protein